MPTRTHAPSPARSGARMSRHAHASVRSNTRTHGPQCARTGGDPVHTQCPLPCWHADPHDLAHPHCTPPAHAAPSGHTQPCTALSPPSPPLGLDVAASRCWPCTVGLGAHPGTAHRGRGRTLLGHEPRGAGTEAKFLQPGRDRKHRRGKASCSPAPSSAVFTGGSCCPETGRGVFPGSAHPGSPSEPPAQKAPCRVPAGRLGSSPPAPGFAPAHPAARGIAAAPLPACSLGLCEAHGLPLPPPIAPALPGCSLPAHPLGPFHAASSPKVSPPPSFCLSLLPTPAPVAPAPSRHPCRGSPRHPPAAPPAPGMAAPAAAVLCHPTATAPEPHGARRRLPTARGTAPTSSSSSNMQARSPRVHARTAPAGALIPFPASSSSRKF